MSAVGLPWPQPPARSAAPSCEARDGCITCGDVAVPLVVVDRAGPDARCRDESGAEELVATDLVGAVAPGDRLLVHAGTAIAVLAPEG